MDYWKMEQNAELQRAQVRQEIAALRLQEEARRAGTHQPGWFGRNMFRLGTWMITVGENLHKRYKVTQAPCQVMRHPTAG